MKKLILCISVFLTLVNCTGFVVKKNVITNYYLIATDVPEDMVLGYYSSDAGDNYEEIIPSTVYEIGHNSKFIIAKQHPRTFPNPPDTTITNYYIVPIITNSVTSMKKIVIGPLTLDGFNVKRKELNIQEDIKFSNVMKTSK